MAPCLHIYAFYHQRWLNHKCLAWNLLRKGYWQWANGCPEAGNNLFEGS